MSLFCSLSTGENADKESIAFSCSWVYSYTVFHAFAESAYQYSCIMLIFMIFVIIELIMIMLTISIFNKIVTTIISVYAFPHRFDIILWKFLQKLFDNSLILFPVNRASRIRYSKRFETCRMS